MAANRDNRTPPVRENHQTPAVPHWSSSRKRDLHSGTAAATPGDRKPHLLIVVDEEWW